MITSHLRLVVAALILDLSAAVCVSQDLWVTLEPGRYLIKRANDGDSFHISVSGKEYIFRLYFVDAPETTSEFRDRVEEQASYFGITVEETLRLGDLAKAFTREKLSRPCKVRTCWENAPGRSRMQRFYAFVQISDGDLGEQLIENGLARVHGASTKSVGIASASPELQKLTRLEQKAKQEKVGGWGANEDRMTARAEEPESAKGVDPFKTSLHSSNVEFANTSPSPISAAIKTPSTVRSNSAVAEMKLDVNTASSAELENVLGIGPVLAQRIIAGRPFKSADDLRNVKGIGRGAKYEKIRPFFN
jgi:DNA uptake protein ComE-like DNA-binding protein